MLREGEDPIGNDVGNNARPSIRGSDRCFLASGGLGPEQQGFNVETARELELRALPISDLD